MKVYSIILYQETEDKKVEKFQGTVESKEDLESYIKEIKKDVDENILKDIDRDLGGIYLGIHTFYLGNEKHKDNTLEFLDYNPSSFTNEEQE